MKSFTIYSIITFFALGTFPGAPALPSQPVKLIKIGLLIPDNKSVEARRAAEMAIENANKKTGSGGPHFQLAVRSLEGSWGVGSKQAVDLIFKEDVWAIVGSHDGQNAHLVEQVTTKSHTVFLSAWAGDPTLSQAFVPWYFSCVPNNNQQANVLAEEIYKRRKMTKIATVSAKDYDSKSALQSFLKEIKSAGKAGPMQLFYEGSDKDFNSLLDQVSKAGMEGIVLFGPPAASQKIIAQMRQKKMGQAVFATLTLFGEGDFTGAGLALYDHAILTTAGDWSGPAGPSFQNEFREKYGKAPGATAAYAYDGMNLMIEAIKNSGFDREKIQAAMTKTNYQGVTGPIRFDDKGNRAGMVSLVEIKNGIPIAVKK